MNNRFEQRLAAISGRPGAAIAGGRKGVEKESLRVDGAGYLSRQRHPRALGSALTNGYITTDFSEALLEFVTPAYTTTWETLRMLCDIHQFTYGHLGDELLWPASMPCRIPENRRIPLARYGSSNVGRMKTIYRRGLGYRYGRHMQTIAGVHFNYSLPEEFWELYRDLIGDGRDETAFRSDQYMGLLRNFRRFGWLLLYLFGASPALCKSFTRGQQPDMPSLNDETLYEPFGTSLRMSDLGYNNQNQSRISISLNSVEEYIRDLSAAIRTPEPAYEKIGVIVDGRYRQLNANILQIENEYYSSIRPKRVARSGERPTMALRRGGIEYVEIRALDINLFDPCGINQNTMRFIEAFLVYCLLMPSPPIDDGGLDEAGRNQLQTAKRGRDPELVLYRDGEAIALTDWAKELLLGVAQVAEVLDRQDRSDAYGGAVTAMRSLVDDADATPSARLLEELRTSDASFFDFTHSVAAGHRDYFRSITPLAEDRRAMLEQAAAESHERQQAVEAADTLTFEQYLANYFSGD
ncbi:MAG: glutamate--cysteine ligase [Woeseiaceae bacterium]|nr:glutamate--cysteine ligase [Woeseiaceae bacterium]